jgi:hypothetical protein
VAKILRWEGAADGERGSHKPVRIHDIDGRLVAIGKCPDNLRDALKVEKVLVYETSLRMKERNRKEGTHGITQGSKN